MKRDAPEKLQTSNIANYRPQMKFAKVMFLQVSVCPQGGGVHGRGACVAGGQGACVAGVGACMAGGCVWQGGMHGRGACVAGGMHCRYYEIRSMSGRYVSYWNAFLC